MSFSPFALLKETTFENVRSIHLKKRAMISPSEGFSQATTHLFLYRLLNLLVSVKTPA